MPLQDDDIKSVLENYYSDFKIYKVPPNIHEGSNFKNTLDNPIPAKVSPDIITLTPRLKTNNV